MSSLEEKISVDLKKQILTDVFAKRPLTELKELIGERILEDIIKKRFRLLPLTEFINEIQNLENSELADLARKIVVEVENPQNIYNYLTAKSFSGVFPDDEILLEFCRKTLVEKSTHDQMFSTYKLFKNTIWKKEIDYKGLNLIREKIVKFTKENSNFKIKAFLFFRKQNDSNGLDALGADFDCLKENLYLAYVYVSKEDRDALNKIKEFLLQDVEKTTEFLEKIDLSKEEEDSFLYELKEKLAKEGDPIRAYTLLKDSEWAHLIKNRLIDKDPTNAYFLFKEFDDKDGIEKLANKFEGPLGIALAVADLENERISNLNPREFYEFAQKIKNPVLLRQSRVKIIHSLNPLKAYKVFLEHNDKEGVEKLEKSLDPSTLYETYQELKSEIAIEPEKIESIQERLLKETELTKVYFLFEKYEDKRGITKLYEILSPQKAYLLNREVNDSENQEQLINRFIDWNPEKAYETFKQNNDSKALEILARRILN